MATAFADALLLLSLALVGFPRHRWLCPLAALAPLIPIWINAFFDWRGPASVFVPDPLSPNYSQFLSSFALSAEQVASGEKGGAIWTLCPVCAKDGRFLPYSLDFIPARHILQLKSSEGAICKAESAILFRPRLALPVVVTDTPVRIKVSPSGVAKQVLLLEDFRAHLFWNNPHGNRMRTELVKGILSAALLAFALFPESTVITPDRLAILTAVLLLVLFKAK